MHTFCRFLCTLLLVTTGFGAAAGEPDPYAAERAALIKLFREIEAGINAQDVERMVAQMHPAATVTWLNGEVSRGHDEIRAYYHRMVKGDQRYLNKYLTKAEVSKPARFLADGTVAIADGTAEDDFFPVSRAPFHLSSRWSASCVKVGGEWKMMTLHLSSNVFTNDLIAEATDAVHYGIAGGAAGGLLIGWLVGRRRKR